MILIILQAPVITPHLPACQLLILIINIPVFHNCLSLLLLCSFPDLLVLFPFLLIPSQDIIADQIPMCLCHVILLLEASSVNITL